jgi:3-hydroxyacyl-CoA dehydrogenase
MQRKIKRVAVLGSGVMGGAIAAHFTNVGIPCLLLDIPAGEGEDPNMISLTGYKNVQKAKPAAFYSKTFASRIQVGNFKDDLEKIADCDMIIEVVIEKMDIKKELFKKIDAVRKPSAIVATNTSGLSVNEMIADCSEDMKKHFIGMHFFNPPRYLKLLEIIPCKHTDPELTRFICDFGENVLGKGIVLCKDTPNFIANRIGSYAISKTIQIMLEDKYTIQEVDAFTGPNIGHPKSATFRTADIVGIDTLSHVSENLYHGLKDDDEKDIFMIPDFIRKMVESGVLGAKTKKGFYLKTEDKEIKFLDYTTGEYLSKEKLKFSSIAAARNQETVEGKIKAIIGAKDRGSEFLWKLISSTFLYCVKRMGEIADTLVNMDNAMQWGWGQQIGPFGKMDILGVSKSVERMKKEGMEIPQIIEDFLADGNGSFYKTENGIDYYYDFPSKSYKEIGRNAKILILKNIKDQNKTVVSNSGATLLDIGDGVACLEFHSKMNTVGPDIISLTKKALDEVDKNFRAMVIGNQHLMAFSAGANLMLLLMNIMEDEWDEVDFMIHTFQKVNMGLRYSPKPVVAAPHGLALGGGCEVTIHADYVVASAETYMGQVELGAGVIPAGGGTKEMLLRTMDGVPPNAIEIPFLQKVFETIAMAKVSTSAEEAKGLGFLKPTDRVIVNSDHQLHYAKQAAIGLAESGYSQPAMRTDIPVLGKEGFAAVKAVVYNMLEGKFITEHDAAIALKLGKVLTGGDITGKQLVSEQYLLDLEREAFLSLCGMRKSLERMKHILETGKPLRN